MPNTKGFVDTLPKQTSIPAPYRVQRGHPLPLGATVHRAGVNFAVFSGHATACWLLLFEPGNQIPIATVFLDPHANRTGEVWRGRVESKS